MTRRGPTPVSKLRSAATLAERASSRPDVLAAVATLRKAATELAARPAALADPRQLPMFP